MREMEEISEGSRTEEQADDGNSETPERVMILFMGRNFEHAKASFQYYSPDAVHLITSEELRKPYVRRLNNWSRSYGFRKGTVQSVTDLFEGSSVNSLLSCVYRISSEEFTYSEGRMETHRWVVGLTGGTMHMAAVATLASNALDATAFYVSRPKEGEAVMPMKQVFEMPTLISLKTAMALSPRSLEALMEEGKGEIPELFEEKVVEPWLMHRLEASGILETHPSQPMWRLTKQGWEILTMVRSGPMFGFRLYDETRETKDGDGYDEAFHG